MEIIGVASDHAGYDLKILIKEYLESKDFIVKDFGCHSNVSCDYPDFAHLLGYAIDNNEVKKGFVFCSSGNGINMTVNKHKGVRSALCWNAEITKLARNHNNANVCSFPAKFVSNEAAKEIVDIFLQEDFDGGRHMKRVNKIPVSE
jgi:ribose 5-phosphate isomerase B